MAGESAFGQVLAEFRRRKGMTRSQLAESSGLSYPYVSQLETGIRKPSRSAGERLAVALGIDPMALEAAVPPKDVTSPSFQRSLRAQAALLSGDEDVLALSIGGPPEPAPRTGRSSPEPSSREDLIGQVVDLVEELDADDRLAALAEIQQVVMQRMLDERSSDAR